MSDTFTAVLPAVPPFDFGCSLRAIDGFVPCRADQTVVDGTVRKAFLHPADPFGAVLVEVGAPPDGVCGVRLTVHSAGPLTAPERASIERSVDRWLGLSEDRTQFLALARADPAMAGLLDVAAGLHQVRFPTLAEGATFFTMTHRTAESLAGKRKHRLTSAYGPPVRFDGDPAMAFPAMSMLRELTDADLVPYSGGLARAARLREVIAGVAELDEEHLRTAPYAEARTTLLGLRWVGPFTAHSLLFRVLGRPDDVPLEMAQFDKLGRAVYGEDAPTPAELRERYGDTIAWWAYLVRTALPWAKVE